ncbi:MAG: hypothetical protein ONB05_12370, partial [candidate division KSB1 bacterium]|nr:hypothetical protein [candidate division KSB1 bacterium]
GISEPVRQDVESYFIAVFERDGQGIRRLFFQKLFVPPVSIRTSEEGLKEKSVMIAFGFYSDYGATLVYRNGKYELEVWEPSAA